MSRGSVSAMRIPTGALSAREQTYCEHNSSAFVSFPPISPGGPINFLIFLADVEQALLKAVDKHCQVSGDLEHRIEEIVCVVPTSAMPPARFLANLRGAENPDPWKPDGLAKSLWLTYAGGRGAQTGPEHRLVQPANLLALLTPTPDNAGLITPPADTHAPLAWRCRRFHEPPGVSQEDARPLWQ